MDVLMSAWNSFQVFSETFRYLEEADRNAHRTEELKSKWAHQTLKKLRVSVAVKGSPALGPALDSTLTSPVLFLGNHISYLDIPVLLSRIPGLSFVAKSEIKSWPVFGRGAQLMNTIFVSRGSGASRAKAGFAVEEALARGARVVIFPSGTTCIGTEKPWRKGAFEVAARSGAWVQPFRLTYDPLRLAAYIDRDFFPVHLYGVFRSGGLRSIIEFHEPVKITDPVSDCERWRTWCSGTPGILAHL
jgi:1-acyl-sn-glycerol-3-phosphate acyltransferase